MELRLKEVIAEKGVTITEIAEKSGIEKGNVSTYVNGRRQPTIETLEKLADAIGVPITEFFEKKQKKGDNEFKCPNCGTRLEVKEKE